MIGVAAKYLKIEECTPGDLLMMPVGLEMCVPALCGISTGTDFVNYVPFQRVDSAEGPFFRRYLDVGQRVLSFGKNFRVQPDYSKGVFDMNKRTPAAGDIAFGLKGNALVLAPSGNGNEVFDIETGTTMPVFTRGAIVPCWSIDLINNQGAAFQTLFINGA
jgi:hypothetical protein